MRPLKPGSQSYLILRHLAGGRTLTPLQGLNLFECLRLGARIFQLRKRGWDIKAQRVRLRSGKTVAKYSMG